MKLRTAILGLASAAFAAAAWGHGSGHGNKQPSPRASAPVEEKAFGRAGDPKKASRTIEIDMSDAMRFTPADISVRRGETVRFMVANSGKQMHEMVIGTAAGLKEHAEMMRKHPGMEHDEPFMAHVEPGRKAELVWQFTRAGAFQYGCLIPGHWEAGMHGKITVTDK